MSTLSVNNIYDAAGGSTAAINGVTPTIYNTMGRNRIINGDMRIDQRYSGAAVGTSISDYTIDRWKILQSVTGKLNGGRNYNSVTPPAGFTNYLGVQSQSAYTVGSTDYYTISQFIEGLNVADFGWGSANAVAITLSFRVYSSLTGTFGGTIKNNAQSRSYAFTYSIPTANTWTTISITIPGDTTGTWTTDNSASIYLNLSLGAGSTYLGTANTWSASNLISATGTVSVVGTNAATFYVTGVQLEAGSVATPFERRPYGTELALCQRYLYKINSDYWKTLAADSSTKAYSTYDFPVQMRVAPTGIVTSGTFILRTPGGSATPSVTWAFNQATSSGSLIEGATSSLTAGQIVMGIGTSSYIYWTGAEL